MNELNINKVIDTKISGFSQTIEEVSSIAELALENSKVDFSSSDAFLSLMLKLEEISDKINQYVKPTKEDPTTVEEYIDLINKDEEMSSELSLFAEISSDLTINVNEENRKKIDSIKESSRQQYIDFLIENGDINSEEDYYEMSEIEIRKFLNNYEKEHPGCFDEDETNAVNLKRDVSYLADFNRGVTYGKIFFDTIENKLEQCSNKFAYPYTIPKVDYTEAFEPLICSPAREYFIAFKYLNLAIEKAINDLNLSQTNINFYTVGFILAAAKNNSKIEEIRKLLKIASTDNEQQTVAIKIKEFTNEENLSVNVFDTGILDALCQRQNVGKEDISQEVWEKIMSSELVAKKYQTLDRKTKLGVAIEILKRYAVDSPYAANKLSARTTGDVVSFLLFMICGVLFGTLGGPIGLISFIILCRPIGMGCAWIGLEIDTNSRDDNDKSVNVIDISKSVFDGLQYIVKKLNKCLEDPYRRFFSVEASDIAAHHIGFTTVEEDREWTGKAKFWTRYDINDFLSATEEYEIPLITTSVGESWTRTFIDGSLEEYSSTKETPTESGTSEITLPGTSPMEITDEDTGTTATVNWKWKELTTGKLYEPGSTVSIQCGTIGRNGSIKETQLNRYEVENGELVKKHYITLGELYTTHFIVDISE